MKRIRMLVLCVALLTTGGCRAFGEILVAGLVRGIVDSDSSHDCCDRCHRSPCRCR